MPTDPGGPPDAMTSDAPALTRKEAQTRLDAACAEVLSLRADLATEYAARGDDIRRLTAAYDLTKADFEALRSRALVITGDATRAPQNDAPGHSHVSTRLIVALRAELDKPSGASFVAERDAWKALAKAERDCAYYPGSYPQIKQRDAAREALRALGIDPEAP